MKFGLNQPNTVVHIDRTGESDERNATCGALWRLAHPLSFLLLSFLISLVSFSLALSLWVSLFLSHSVVFVANFLRTISYVRGVI